MKPLFTVYRYAWMYIPTGATGEDSQEFVSQAAFLSELAKWNRLGGTTWKYWSL